MKASRLETKVGVKPRSPKGRASARGLDARRRIQHAFMPMGDASTKGAQADPKNTLTAITVSTATIGCALRNGFEGSFSPIRVFVLASKISSPEYGF